MFQALEFVPMNSTAWFWGLGCFQNSLKVCLDYCNPILIYPNSWISPNPFLLPLKRCNLPFHRPLYLTGSFRKPIDFPVWISWMLLHHCRSSSWSDVVSSVWQWGPAFWNLEYVWEEAIFSLFNSGLLCSCFVVMAWFSIKYLSLSLCYVFFGLCWDNNWRHYYDPVYLKRSQRQVAIGLLATHQVGCLRN